MLAQALATKGFKSTKWPLADFSISLFRNWIKCWHSSMQSRSKVLPKSEWAWGKVNFCRMCLRFFCSSELLAKARAGKRKYCFWTMHCAGEKVNPFVYTLYILQRRSTIWLGYRYTLDLFDLDINNAKRCFLRCFMIIIIRDMFISNLLYLWLRSVWQLQDGCR